MIEARYDHIVGFERLLAERGTRVVKFLLHVSKDYQLERMRRRLERPDKHWKFNPDDLSDRARWDDFQKAYEDLIEKTTNEHAPWFVIPADRKWYRNLVVARIMVDVLRGLKMDFPTVNWDPKSVVIE